jgi:hypothetical protein
VSEGWSTAAGRSDNHKWNFKTADHEHVHVISDVVVIGFFLMPGGGRESPVAGIADCERDGRGNRLRIGAHTGAWGERASHPRIVYLIDSNALARFRNGVLVSTGQVVNPCGWLSLAAY